MHRHLGYLAVHAGGVEFKAGDHFCRIEHAGWRGAILLIGMKGDRFQVVIDDET